MRDKLNSGFWSNCVYNSVVIVCFAGVSIKFDKWWIILFAALFIQTFKTKVDVNGHHRICDGCGAKGPTAKTSDDAIKEASKLGWINIGGTLDYCPECQKKQNGGI